MPTTKTPSRPAVKRAVPRKAVRRSAPVAAPVAAPAAAPVAKRTPAPAAKPAKPPKPSKPVNGTKAAKAVKPPKVRTKPVRDSFTMPEADFALIATLKARTMSAKRETKKSELLRAGLHALAALDTVALVAALGALEPVKIGRPKSDR